uniref:Uncharacterized protein n=1 Tax=Pithovirus LCPAC401 TaxID=2506595 RepID=A0A481ZCI3_9VIRU|nr:MAG: hypothetical protein LCPAC401_00090 [Pithovirus LCPAC401]
MKRSECEDSPPPPPPPKKAKHGNEIVVDKKGLFGSLSTNHQMICYLYQNRSDLILSLPLYSGIKDIKILTPRYLYGLCTIGMGKPYLHRYLDTISSTTFILNENKLEDYWKSVKLNKSLALATHPMVLQYVREENPKDLCFVRVPIDKEIRQFTSANVTINIVVDKGVKFKQLN